ncbi:DNA repair protein RecO [Pseudomonadota bacterium]|jgi:DNA repair protein RecO (recombination protein O)|nr:DNA repair protein RecO [Xanthomonadales bacterium]
MRAQLEPSFILHSRPYHESSVLLEAFSREHGRIGLVARGARGARSRWKNMLQPFRPLLLSWTQRGELGTLTDADQVAAPPALAGEPLFCALYGNELLVRFLQRSDPHAGLFDQYRRMLAELADGRAAQPILRLFEYHVLSAAGFGLQLEHDSVSGQEIRPDAWYLYQPESGPVLRGRENGPADELVSGAALLALKSGVIGEQHLRELKNLMRKLIRYYLGDRVINSQQLFS